MWQQASRKYDIEGGSQQLYPVMLENPELRWSFIRKVYSIIAIQLLATIAVGAVVVSYEPIALFFTSSSGGLACYIILIITPFIGINSLSLSLFLILGFIFGDFYVGI